MEQLTPEVLGIIGLSLLFALVGGTLWVAGPEIRGFFRWLLHRYVNVSAVKASAGGSGHYGNGRDDEDEDGGAFFRGGKGETENNAETETTPKQPVGLTSADINLLRREEKAAALGALLAHGLIVPGKRTAAMRAVFGNITGDAYTKTGGAVKRHEAAVAATLPPAEIAEDETDEARIIPINDGKRGYVEM